MRGYLIELDGHDFLRNEEYDLIHHEKKWVSMEEKQASVFLIDRVELQYDMLSMKMRPYALDDSFDIFE